LVVRAAGTDLGRASELGGEVGLVVVHVVSAARERAAPLVARLGTAGLRDEAPDRGAGGVVREVVVHGHDADVVARRMGELLLDAVDEARKARDEALLVVAHAAGVIDDEEHIDVLALAARATVAGPALEAAHAPLAGRARASTSCPRGRGVGLAEGVAIVRGT